MAGTKNGKQQIQQKRVKHFYDYSLLFGVLFITGFGLLMMYSASSYSAQSQLNDAMYYLKRQGFFAVVGIALMVAVSQVDYHRLWRASIPIYAGAWVCVIVTLVMGVSSHGSKRWINLFGVRFQPSEVMKAAIIITMAYVVTKLGSRLSNKGSWVKTLLIGLIPFVVIAKTNLSTAIIILGITGFMIFVASRKYLFYLGGACVIMLLYVFAYQATNVLMFLHLFQPYQLIRILAWLDPANYVDDTYQTLQGLYAIGSGGIFGKGLGESVQKMLIPEAQNDMIFTIICEELGMFGAVSLILMYAFIIYRMYDIARNAKDLFGSMLVIGVMIHISLQAILNIAVATNSIPNTGITLPFVSYGGTSLLLLMLECGMCLSVSKQIELRE